MPRKFVERICTICSQPFQGDPRATVCFDPACRKARQKQFQQASDTKRGSATRRGVIPESSQPVAAQSSAAKSSKPGKAPVPKVIAPKLPWAISGICQAVSLGLSSAPAQKIGVFYVVDFGREGYKPFIPRGDNEWRATSAQKIAVIARLNPRGKWDLRPQEAT